MTGLRGKRGLTVWCLALDLLAVALLVQRPADWSQPARAIAVALLASVGGVLAGRRVARRLVCAVVVLLGLVCLPHAPVRGLLTIVAGAVGVALAPSWPALGRRFGAGSAGGADSGDAGALRDAQPRHADDPWSRLDRGEDPTL